MILQPGTIAETRANAHF